MRRAAMNVRTKGRGFDLEAIPEGIDTYGLHLREVGSGTDGRPAIDLRVKASRARRVIESALLAVKRSGHPKGALGLQRVHPLTITEEAGVRLALVLLATAPLVKSRRVDTMLQAVDAMATEEAYYWYAKCVGESGARARRALRLLLAEE